MVINMVAKMVVRGNGFGIVDGAIGVRDHVTQWDFGSNKVIKMESPLQRECIWGKWRNFWW